MGIRYQADESVTERRRGLRISQECAVKLFEPTANKYLPGRTADLSNTGLKLELLASAPVCVGRLVTVHINRGGVGDALVSKRTMLPARIVWTRRHQSTVDVGLEFLTAAAGSAAMGAA